MTTLKVRRIDFYPDEWIAGTVSLDNATRGLYITACALIYSHGGPIEIDHLKCASGDHGHAFKRQLDLLIRLGKLIVNGTQIANKRAINELQTAVKRIVNASQNGTKGNEIKKVIAATRCGVANANYQLPTTNSISIDTNVSISRPNRRLDKPDRFAEFYGVYPRHEARGDALKAWGAACKRADADVIIAAAKRYAERRAGEDKQFTKLPATWLRRECWTDEDIVPVMDSDDAISDEEIEAARLRVLAKLQENPNVLPA